MLSPADSSSGSSMYASVKSSPLMPSLLPVSSGRLISGAGSSVSSVSARAEKGKKVIASRTASREVNEWLNLIISSSLLSFTGYLIRCFSVLTRM